VCTEGVLAPEHYEHLPYTVGVLYVRCVYGVCMVCVWVYGVCMVNTTTPALHSRSAVCMGVRCVYGVCMCVRGMYGEHYEHLPYTVGVLYVRCTVYVWCMYGVCMVCVWVYGVCMVYVWCMYGVCMGVQGMYGEHHEQVPYTVGVLRVYGVCMVCVCVHGGRPHSRTLQTPALHNRSAVCMGVRCVYAVCTCARRASSLPNTTNTCPTQSECCMYGVCIVYVWCMYGVCMV